MPVRTYRCSDPLYEDMQRATSDRGETITDVILRAFEAYVRDWKDDPTRHDNGSPS